MRTRTEYPEGTRIGGPDKVDQRLPDVSTSEERAAIGPWKVYAGLLTALIVAAWLTTFRLVEVAESMAPGAARNSAIAVTSAYHAVARFSGLARPAEIVYGALGRSPWDGTPAGTTSWWTTQPDSDVVTASAPDGEDLRDSDTNFNADSRPDGTGTGARQLTGAGSMVRRARSSAVAPPSTAVTTRAANPAGGLKHSERGGLVRGRPFLGGKDAGENGDSVSLTDGVAADSASRRTGGERKVVGSLSPGADTDRDVVSGDSPGVLSDRGAGSDDTPAARVERRMGANDEKSAGSAEIDRAPALETRGSEPRERSRTATGPGRWPADTPAPPLSASTDSLARKSRLAEPSASDDDPLSARVYPRTTSTLATRPNAPRDPIAVLVAGDSMAEPLGYELSDHAVRDGLISVDVDFKISSGLVRPDYYDWWARLAFLMSDPVLSDSESARTVVWFSGGNDNQVLQTEDGIVAIGTPEWQAEYARRAGALMDTVLSGGATMVWVGLPPVRDEAHALAARQMNTAAVREAAKRKGVRVVDLHTMFGGPNGEFTAYLPGPEGRTVRVRQEDGVHLTSEGTAWVADVVYGHILAEAGIERPPRR